MLVILLILPLFSHNVSILLILLCCLVCLQSGGASCTIYLWEFNINKFQKVKKHPTLVSVAVLWVPIVIKTVTVIVTVIVRCLRLDLYGPLCF